MKIQVGLLHLACDSSAVLPRVLVFCRVERLLTCSCGIDWQVVGIDGYRLWVLGEYFIGYY